MANSHPLRVGLFGIGLEAYWPQFVGLKAKLEGYLGQVAGKLGRTGVEVCNLGLVDSPEKAMEAGHAMRRNDVDIIFLHVTTYALSSTVLPVVQRAKVPVIILNLQPVAAMDYQKFNQMGDRTKMTGEWLAHCGACPVPEIANAFNRARIGFHQVTGTLQPGDPAWKETDDWIEAARVAHIMAHNRLGLMGHYYNGMLDIHTDTTRQIAYFGGHLEIVEVEELAALRRGVKPAGPSAKSPWPRWRLPAAVPFGKTSLFSWSSCGAVSPPTSSGASFSTSVTAPPISTSTRTLPTRRRWGRRKA